MFDRRPHHFQALNRDTIHQPLNIVLTIFTLIDIWHPVTFGGHELRESLEMMRYPDILLLWGFDDM